MSGEITVHGLKEFNRGLRRISSEAPKGLRLAGNKAADIVVKHAKPRVPTGPPKGGHALSSVRAKSTRTAARVSGGGARFPYYPWLEFGGRVGINNSIHRNFIKKGRYIWPAFTGNREAVQSELYDALVEVARSAGIGVD